MGPIENLSPYGFAQLPNVDRKGEEIAIVAVAAHFMLPQPGRPHAGPLARCDEQPPPHFDDVYWGEPGKSSLRYEGQSAYTRPGTDVHVNASAHAPGGRPVEQMDVDVTVGPCRLRARVIGDRVWVGAAGTLRASPPVPFVRMPLLWERAFGGGDVAAGGRGYEPRNPVGTGVCSSLEQVSGTKLPNLENPAELVREPWSRPAPVGFGPVARHWWPRWIETRAPLWPDDFDERFFSAAPAGACAAPHLRGGESVMMSGVHPAGGFGFRLPIVRLCCKSVFGAHTQRVGMRLDAVILEPDDGRVTLILRAVVGLGRRSDHRHTIVRALEDWETMPNVPAWPEVRA
jgi:hypothetical protein